MATPDKAETTQIDQEEAIILRTGLAEIIMKGPNPEEKKPLLGIIEGTRKMGIPMALPSEFIKQHIATCEVHDIKNIFDSIEISAEDYTEYMMLADELSKEAESLKALAIYSGLGAEGKVSSYIVTAMIHSPLDVTEAIELAYGRSCNQQENEYIAENFIRLEIDMKMGWYQGENTKDPNEYELWTARKAAELMKIADSNNGESWAKVFKEYKKHFDICLQIPGNNILLRGTDLRDMKLAATKSDISEEEKRSATREIAGLYLADNQKIIVPSKEKMITKGFTLLHEIGELTEQKRKEVVQRFEDSPQWEFNGDKILEALSFGIEGGLQPNLSEMSRIGDTFSVNKGMSLFFIEARRFYAAANDKEGLKNLASFKWQDATGARDYYIDYHGQSEIFSKIIRENNGKVSTAFEICANANIVFDDKKLYQWIIDLEMSNNTPKIENLTTAISHMARLEASKVTAE